MRRSSFRDLKISAWVTKILARVSGRIRFSMKKPRFSPPFSYFFVFRVIKILSEKHRNLDKSAVAVKNMENMVAVKVRFSSEGTVHYEFSKGLYEGSSPTDSLVCP